MACCPLAPDNDLLWAYSRSSGAAATAECSLTASCPQSLYSYGRRRQNVCMRWVSSPFLQRSVPSGGDPPPCGSVQSSIWTLCPFFTSAFNVVCAGFFFIHSPLPVTINTLTWCQSQRSSQDLIKKKKKKTHLWVSSSKMYLFDFALHNKEHYTDKNKIHWIHYVAYKSVYK